MKISRKSFAIILMGLALVATIFLTSLNTLIDKNRDRIRDEIQKATGRSITFDELQLSLWSGLGLTAKNLSIAEDPRFAATPIIQTKELKMQVGWLPLLFGKIEIKEFILKEPEIQIIKNEAGEFNVLALTSREKKAKGSQKVSKKKKRRAGSMLLLSAIQLTNSTVHYIDRSLKEPIEIRIRNLDFSLHGLALTGTTKIRLAANLLAGQGQNLWLEGQMGPFKDKKDWNQHPLDLQVQIDPIHLPQLTRAIPFLRGKVPPELNITGPLFFKSRLQGTLERPLISDLTLKGPFFGSTGNNVTATGELNFSKSGSLEDAEFKGKLVVDPVSFGQLKKIPYIKKALPVSLSLEGPLSVTSDLQGKLKELKVHTLVKARKSEIRYGNWFKKASGIPAELDVNVVRQKDRLVIEKSALSINNLILQFSGLLYDLPDRYISMRLSTEGMDLTGWDGLLLPLSPYSVGGKVRWDLSIKKDLSSPNKKINILGSLNLDDVRAKDKKSGQSIEKITALVSFLGKKARVQNASLRYGSSDLNFEATLPDLFQPNFSYILQSPQINLANLTGNVAHKGDGMKALRSTGEFRMQKGKPTLQGKLSSSEGTLQDIPYRNLQGDVLWSPSRLSFENLSFDALNGSLLANGSWAEGTKNFQRLALNTNIEAMDLKALLSKKIPKFKDHIEGRLDFKANLRGSSIDGTNLQTNLQGKGETLVRDGSLKDFNLVREVLSKITGLPGISSLISSRLPSRYRIIFDRKDTPFDTMEASFTVEKGRIRSDDLLLATPDYSIDGKGWIGFDKTMKWDANLVMSSQFTKELIEEHRNVRYMVDRRGRLAIPFRLEGTLPNVRPKPDIRALTERITSGLMKKGMERFLGKKKGKNKKDVQDWIQKGIEQLFGK
ncbi:MAG: AsmA family protein [Candidatus Binatia bacterium]